jgi:hypothetical protein
MRIVRSSWPVFLLTAVSPATAEAAGVTAAIFSAEPGEISQARALDLARQAAALEGYDPAQYPVTSVEQDVDGTWVVFLEHVPPAAPGQHCLVYVSPDGATRVVHGR